MSSRPFKPLIGTWTSRNDHPHSFSGIYQPSRNEERAEQNASSLSIHDLMDLEEEDGHYIFGERRDSVSTTDLGTPALTAGDLSESTRIDSHGPSFQPQVVTPSLLYSLPPASSTLLDDTPLPPGVPSTDAREAREDNAPGSWDTLAQQNRDRKGKAKAIDDDMGNSQATEWHDNARSLQQGIEGKGEVTVLDTTPEALQDLGGIRAVPLVRDDSSVTVGSNAEQKQEEREVRKLLLPEHDEGHQDQEGTEQQEANDDRPEHGTDADDSGEEQSDTDEDDDCEQVHEATVHYSFIREDSLFDTRRTGQQPLGNRDHAGPFYIC